MLTTRLHNQCISAIKSGSRDSLLKCLKALKTAKLYDKSTHGSKTKMIERILEVMHRQPESVTYTVTFSNGEVTFTQKR